MNNTITNEFVFNTGWKKKVKMKLFDKEFEVTIKLKAYFKEDGITPEQEKSYAIYRDENVNLYKTIEKLLMDFDSNAEVRFTPSTLIFERNGPYALLCDDNLNPDDGIVVCLEPTKKIVSQDDYL